MKLHKGITGFACLFLLSTPYNVSAASAEELREKCISFGAVPGTSGFYNCMREFDRGTTQNEERNRVVEGCENKRILFRGEALRACPMADGRCVHETTERQVQTCINNALGLGGDNRRNRRTCKREGSRIVCEDD